MAASLIRENDLNPRHRRRYVATTDSDHDHPIFPNRAKELVPDGPKRHPSSVRVGSTTLSRTTMRKAVGASRELELFCIDRSTIMILLRHGLPEGLEETESIGNAID